VLLIQIREFLMIECTCTTVWYRNIRLKHVGLVLSYLNYCNTTQFIAVSSITDFT